MIVCSIVFSNFSLSTMSMFLFNMFIFLILFDYRFEKRFNEVHVDKDDGEVQG